MATEEHETIDGELVSYEEPTPATIFRTSDPRVALERMTEASKLLFTVVEDRKLYVTIGGKKHLFVSAWTTLGAMLGLFPVVAWTRPNETGDGYLARVEVLTRTGQLVGAAEAECSRAEQRWKTREPFTLRSMASTRATSRALRGPLEQVVVLAGYEPAGAEEMPAELEPARERMPAPALPEQVRPTAEQGERLRALIARLNEHDADTDWLVRAAELAGVPWDKLTRAGADGVIRQLEKQLADLGVERGAS